MFDLAGSLLAFSGFATLLIGLLCGRPLVIAINRNRGEDKIRAWRVAHSSLIMGGIMLLVIALVLPKLALSSGWQLVVSILLSASIAAFDYALVFGAANGYRGLRKDGGGAAASVYYANLWGAYLSVASVVLLVYGASVSLVTKLFA
jgi:hypothetical protein